MRRKFWAFGDRRGEFNFAKPVSFERACRQLAFLGNRAMNSSTPVALSAASGRASSGDFWRKIERFLKGSHACPGARPRSHHFRGERSAPLSLGDCASRIETGDFFNRKCRSIRVYPNERNSVAYATNIGSCSSSLTVRSAASLWTVRPFVCSWRTGGIASTSRKFPSLFGIIRHECDSV